MQKIRKQHVKAPNENHTVRRQTTVSFPEIVDIDVLGSMLDEDLVLRFRDIDEDRTRALESGRPDLRPWEEELAYVRREQQIRRTRRDLHPEITRRIDAENWRIEASLPAGDFDNSAFVYASIGGRMRWN